MGTYQFLLLERRGGVLVVSLNRPDRLNALNPAVMAELTALFASLGGEEGAGIRVVVLQGEGRAFCAGADIGSDAFAPAGPGRAQRQFAMQKLASGLIREMRACPQPIIALCHGAVCGGGFSLALAADVRLVTPDCRMNAAYLRVGLGGTDMGSGYLLTRLIGYSMASRYLLTGDFIVAEVAERLGLAAGIHAREELLEAGLAMAERMLDASPMGLRLTKDALNMLVDAPSFDAAIALEDRQQVILMETADHREALAAFMEKRKPVYRDE
ncbi:enoyl-CoA hydratase/isomerase family protein [Sphingomonas sp. ID0503]|uniref:enoyl-CoA hydratase/isomerase family protein n=1 Tax=Sphingomonas sp. ID0503 TaxID=3399691 RepID=UPI003AFB2EE1